MKTINPNDTVYDLVKTNPELKEILHDIGFTHIVKKGMLESVGRFMTLKKGAQSKNISLGKLEDELNRYHYTMEE